ncbi:hypothetical protein THAOC_13880, partial [Thalassiosira oceanica]
SKPNLFHLPIPGPDGVEELNRQQQEERKVELDGDAADARTQRNCRWMPPSTLNVIGPSREPNGNLEVISTQSHESEIDLSHQTTTPVRPILEKPQKTPYCKAFYNDIERRLAAIAEFPELVGAEIDHRIQPHRPRQSAAAVPMTIALTHIRALRRLYDCVPYDRVEERRAGVWPTSTSLVRRGAIVENRRQQGPGSLPDGEDDTGERGDGEVRRGSPRRGGASPAGEGGCDTRTQQSALLTEASYSFVGRLFIVRIQLRAVSWNRPAALFPSAPSDPRRGPSFESYRKLCQGAPVRARLPRPRRDGDAPSSRSSPGPPGDGATPGSKARAKGPWPDPPRRTSCWRSVVPTAGPYPPAAGFGRTAPRAVVGGGGNLGRLPRA